MSIKFCDLVDQITSSWKKIKLLNDLNQHSIDLIIQYDVIELIMYFFMWLLCFKNYNKFQ